MNLTYITQQKELDTVCNNIKQKKPSILSVDTEFLRKTTYWPKLCLNQLAFEDEVILIDPLDGLLNLLPLKEVFFDDKILKVFHAARQDLEVFYALWGQLPQNIADTQIIAMVCGFGDCISYEKLSESLVNTGLDKSQQHTDWSKRPLSDKQINYAIGDVLNLEAIYKKLIKQAGKKIEYTTSELSLLKIETTYKTDPEQAWLRIRITSNYKPDLGVLQAIAAVRELYAQKNDIARSHVIKDEVLLKIALKKEISQQDLANYGVRKEDLRDLLIEACSTATPIKRPTQTPKLKEASILIEVLKILLKTQAEHHGIAPKLISNKEGLESFFENPETSTLSKGWRFDVFGKTALQILKGEVGLVFDPLTYKPNFYPVK